MRCNLWSDGCFRVITAFYVESQQGFPIQEALAGLTIQAGYISISTFTKKSQAKTSLTPIDLKNP
jgi:hypothetical protein